MPKDVFLSVRLDGPTKLRLEAFAKERGLSLGEFCRQIVDEYLLAQGEPADPNVRLPSEPSLADSRRMALHELKERYLRRFPGGEDDGYQLQWVRACLSNIRALTNADPRAVLAEVRALVGIPSWATPGGEVDGGTA
jgi:hypothetical protein